MAQDLQIHRVDEDRFSNHYKGLSHARFRPSRRSHSGHTSSGDWASGGSTDELSGGASGGGSGDKFTKGNEEDGGDGEGGGREDWLIKETKRRVWWVCFIVDRLGAMAAGRPSTIDTADCEVLIPSMDYLWETGRLPTDPDSQDKDEFSTLKSDGSVEEEDEEGDEGDSFRFQDISTFLDPRTFIPATEMPLAHGAGEELTNEALVNPKGNPLKGIPEDSSTSPSTSSNPPPSSSVCTDKKGPASSRRMSLQYVGTSSDLASSPAVKRSAEEQKGWGERLVRKGYSRYAFMLKLVGIMGHVVHFLSRPYRKASTTGLSRDPSVRSGGGNRTDGGGGPLRMSLANGESLHDASSATAGSEALYRILSQALASWPYSLPLCLRYGERTGLLEPPPDNRYATFARCIHVFHRTTWILLERARLVALLQPIPSSSDEQDSSSSQEERHAHPPLPKRRMRLGGREYVWDEQVIGSILQSRRSAAVVARIAREWTDTPAVACHVILPFCYFQCARVLVRAMDDTDIPSSYSNPDPDRSEEDGNPDAFGSDGIMGPEEARHGFLVLVKALKECRKLWRLADNYLAILADMAGRSPYWQTWQASLNQSVKEEGDGKHH